MNTPRRGNRTNFMVSWVWWQWGEATLGRSVGRRKVDEMEGGNEERDGRN